MGRVVGALCGPCFSSNSTAGDILEGQLFAYGVASSVAVVDVAQFQVACMLQGGHGRAPVTAVSWNPECHSRNLTSAGHLRLASGDKEGTVVVWDVLRVASICKLGDPRNSLEGSDGVKSLAWVLSDPCLLAVVLAPATIMIWDIRGGGVVWQKEMQGIGAMHSLTVDAFNRKCICASGDSGVCVLMELHDVHRDRVNVKQYRVTSPGTSGSTNSVNIHCVFPAPRDLMLVMLNREIILFDVEFGQPVASFRLPATHRPFSKILSVHGQDVSMGTGREGGIQCIHCLHEDGCVTVWQKKPEKLSYSCINTSRLTPPPLRGWGGSTPKLSIMTAIACVWRQMQFNTNPAQFPDQLTTQKTPLLPPQSLLLITVMNNGQVWKWDVCLTPPNSQTSLNYASNALNVLNVPSSSPQRSPKIDQMTVEVSGRIVENLIEPSSPAISVNSLGTPKGDRTGCEQWIKLCGTLNMLPSAVTTLSVLPKVLVDTGIGQGGGRKVKDDRLGASPEAVGGEVQANVLEGVQEGLQGEVQANVLEGVREGTVQNTAEASAGQDEVQDKVQANVLEGVQGEVQDKVQANVQDITTHPNKPSIPGNDESPFAIAVKAKQHSNTPPWATSPTASDSQEILEASSCTPLLAVVTSAGTLDVIPVHRGTITGASLEVSRSFGIHKDRGRSVRWLGSSPLVVSFSSEKKENGWKNNLILTDARTGESAPFREVGPESVAMLGIRTSPSGRYILVLLKDAPAEIWLVSGLRYIRRVRHVEIPFTAVEWAVPEGPCFDPLTTEHWEMWGCNQTSEDWEGGVFVNDAPPETLVFAVNDGRVGTFTIKGKKVIDSKLRRPMWGSVGSASNQVRCISVACLGNLVFLGDYEGRLTKWDMATGASTMVATDSGPIRRIQVVPGGTDSMSDSTPGGTKIQQVRLAVLSATWKCSLWELNDRKQLVKLPFQNTFRFLDIAWLPCASPNLPSTLLSAVTEEGSIAIVDTEHLDRPRSLSVDVTGTGTVQEYGLHNPLGNGNFSSTQELVGMLGGEPSMGSSLLLPTPLILLLRLVIQVGIPEHIFRHILGTDSTASDDAIETELWTYLPGAIDSLEKNQFPIGDAPDAGTGLETLAEDEYVCVDKKSTEKEALQWEMKHSTGRRNSRRRVKRLNSTLTMFRKTRNLSLASEVLASYEAEESRTKGLLRKMKGAVSKVKAKKSPTEQPEQKNYTMRTSADFEEGVSASDVSSFLPDSETLLDVLRALAVLRNKGNLLMQEEWAAYKKALNAPYKTPARMCIAAQVSGNNEEVEFWRHLPQTLALVKERAVKEFSWGEKSEPTQQESPAESNAEWMLWTESMAISNAVERVHWHEAIPRVNIEAHRTLQDRLLLEYVCLGDFNTAVGFLLASAPEASTRYYRDSLCALALAAASGSGNRSDATQNSAENKSDQVPSNSLHLQVAKVVSAHAATVGDSLLGVPLLCSSGLAQEAVSLLQDAGLWRYASTLTASKLNGVDHALSCLRWAQYILREEGSLWRSVGILTAGGCLNEATQVLRDAGLPDCAAAYIASCDEAGLVSTSEKSTTDNISEISHNINQRNLFSALNSTQIVRISKKDDSSKNRKEDDLLDELAKVELGFEKYVSDLLGLF